MCDMEDERDMMAFVHHCARTCKTLSHDNVHGIMGDMRSAIPDVDRRAPYFRNEATMPSLRNVRELGETVCGLRTR